MFLAHVLGTVVATRRYEATRGYRLLWVQPLDHRGEPAGEPEVALDTVLSGSGDRVICVIGREASMAMDREERFSPVDLSIVGFVDRVDGNAEVAKKEKPPSRRGRRPQKRRSGAGRARS